MAPAFSSPRQAGVFAFLLAAAVLLPALLSPWALPSREQAYASYGWGSGAYPYMQQQIFHEKGDIDILFIGSSHMNSGIDPEYVQKKLSAELGRPATVISLCWGGAGFDMLYFIAHDLLEHRKVHMMVFYDEPGKDQPNGLVWRLVRWGDRNEALDGLPLPNKLAYYYGAITSLPRNLFNLLKPAMPANLSPAKMMFSSDLEFKPAQFRPLKSGPGNPSARDGEREAARSLDGAQGREVEIYSPQSEATFAFSEDPPKPFQVYFARQVLALAKAHDTRLVCLNIPTMAQKNAGYVDAGSLWSEVFRSDSALVGIPPIKLFAGMIEDHIPSLFRNPTHLSGEGQGYFTATVTPTLIKIYEQAAH